MSSICSQYITGYSIPRQFSQSSQLEFMKRWQVQHSKEHDDIFNRLEGFQTSLSLPAYKINVASLSFQPEDPKSVNDFLFNNHFQHQEFYGWVNQLGALLPSYGKPPLVVYPRLNPNTKTMKIDTKFFNGFLLSEQFVHTNLLAAINALYSAYGL